MRTPVSPSTIAFSSEPPSASPFCRSISTSFRNVNVRAGATSSANDVLGDAQRPRLMPQQRMVVADAVGDLEVIRGVERDALVAARDRDRAHDLQILPRRLQPLHARFVNDVEERRRAAVHDRHFRRVQLDDDVVDPHADERREQMLDRLDRHFVARQAGRELNPRQVVHRRGHFVIAQIGATEPDAEISRCGFECEIDLDAGVKTDSVTRNLATKRCAVRP